MQTKPTLPLLGALVFSLTPIESMFDGSQNTYLAH